MPLDVPPLLWRRTPSSSLLRCLAAGLLSPAGAYQSAFASGDRTYQENEGRIGGSWAEGGDAAQGFRHPGGRLTKYDEICVYPLNIPNGMHRVARARVVESSWQTNQIFPPIPAWSNICACDMQH